MTPFELLCVWPVGAELGEGPAWDADTRTLYFVDIKGRQVHRYGENGARASWPAPQQVGFVLPIDGGDFACALEDGLYRFSPDTGAFTLLRHVERDMAGNRFNDGYVDAHGCLWFGSMDNGEEAATGSLYCLDAQARLTLADPDYVITNGPAMSPDGRTLYHTDTLAKTVYCFDVLASGGLANKRPFVTIEGTGHPDGMAVDAGGTVWIALFGGGRIERYTPSGALIDAISFPCSNVTKLTFGGVDLRTVFVTTAWKGLSPEDRAREPLAGALFALRSPVPGQKQHAIAAGAFA